MSKDIIVFTDGSSRGNPGPGGWASIIATTNNVYELAGRSDHTTNNRMELTAVIESLKFISDNNQHDAQVVINTDSQYVKKGAENWVYGWQKNHWQNSKKEPVLNQDLWQDLLELLGLFNKLEFRYVRGHVGVPANERADELATLSADDLAPTLYKGTRKNYPIKSLGDSSETNISRSVSSQIRSSSLPTLGYLSMVDGQIERHKIWQECKDRVNGKKGAKFRKYNSETEASEILETWRRSS